MRDSCISATRRCLIQQCSTPPPARTAYRLKETAHMSARQKLNQGYIQGSLVIAGAIGVACESWVVFWIAALILVGLSTHSGEIRPTQRRRDQRSPHGRRSTNDRRR